MAEINDFETTDANNTLRWPEGMTGAQVNDSARADEGILARWHKDTNGSLASGGSSNAYTLSPNRTISAHYDGLLFVFEANHTNDGAATLQLSGLNAKDIRRTDDSALTGGEIVSGGKYFVVFDSSTDRWQLLNPLTVASVDIANQTAETDPASDDELLIQDVSVPGNRKMTFTNFMKVINALSAETSPATDDELALYDADGGATDKITLANLLKVINALTEDTDPDSNSDFLLTYDADASAVKKAKIVNVASGQLIAIIEDQKSSGTDGGSFNSGADRTRDLNTLVFNRDTIVSLSSNQFTLPAGDWEIEWSAPAGTVSSHQTILRDISAGSDVKRGASVNTNTDESPQVHYTVSFGSARVSIAGSTTYEIRHRCSSSESTNGFGRSAGLGTEVYTRVTIRRG